MTESIPNPPFEAKIQHLEKFDEENPWAFISIFASTEE